MQHIDPTVLPDNVETQRTPDAAIAVKRTVFAAGIFGMPPGFDPDHFPIIARHFFGWRPGHPICEHLLFRGHPPLARHTEGALTMSSKRIIDIFRQLSRGEILEHQSRRYFLRGNRVPSRLARRLVRSGFVEPPPNLFAPDGGWITTRGLAELQRLEKNDV